MRVFLYDYPISELHAQCFRHNHVAHLLYLILSSFRTQNVCCLILISPFQCYAVLSLRNATLHFLYPVCHFWVCVFLLNYNAQLWFLLTWNWVLVKFKYPALLSHAVLFNFICFWCTDFKILSVVTLKFL